MITVTQKVLGKIFDLCGRKILYFSVGWVERRERWVSLLSQL
jgi:hypothetical protein